MLKEIQYLVRSVSISLLTILGGTELNLRGAPEPPIQLWVKCEGGPFTMDSALHRGLGDSLTTASQEKLLLFQKAGALTSDRVKQILVNADPARARLLKPGGKTPTENVEEAPTISLNL
ncbi:MAG: hypothetical protein U1G07_09885 [Verrucomicrobiota bacterium]